MPRFPNPICWRDPVQGKEHEHPLLQHHHQRVECWLAGGGFANTIPPEKQTYMRQGARPPAVCMRAETSRPRIDGKSRISLLQFATHRPYMQRCSCPASSLLGLLLLPLAGALVVRAFFLRPAAAAAAEIAAERRGLLHLPAPRCCNSIPLINRARACASFNQQGWGAWWPRSAPASCVAIKF